METVPSALQELLNQTPVRTGTSKRSAVRIQMDANEGTFIKLAELGHSNASIADAFMASFPEVRQERQDLSGEDYKTHVMTTLDSFKRKARSQGILQKSKAKKTAPRSTGKSKEGQVPQMVAIEPPAPTIEPVAATEVDDTVDFIDLKPVATEPSKPAVVIPTNAGYPIPKAKDF